MSIYCTYLTIYQGNKLPPFYIGYSLTSKVKEKSYHGTPTSKRYSKTFKQEEKENPHLFKTIVLGQYCTQKEAKERESYLLNFFNAKHNPMYINMANSDGSLIRPKGTPCSEETKRRISISLAGNKHPRFGKVVSEDIRKRIAQSKSKIPFSEDHKRNISISKSMKITDGTQIYDSIKEAAKHYGKSNTYITNRINSSDYPNWIIL